MCLRGETRGKQAGSDRRVLSSAINSALKSSTGQQVAPKIRLREEGLKGARCEPRVAAPQQPPDSAAGPGRPEGAGKRPRGAREPLSARSRVGLQPPGSGRSPRPPEGREGRAGSGGNGAPPAAPHSPPRWEMCRQRKRCRLGRWSSPGHLRRRAEVRTYPPSVESR